jgi:hypothetical protein
VSDRLNAVLNSYGRNIVISSWIRPTSVNVGKLDNRGRIVRDPNNYYNGKDYNAIYRESSRNLHPTGLAIDIVDVGNRSFTRFLLSRQDLLESALLWMEDEKSATTWVHLDAGERSTNGRPRGRERIFTP